ncbi:MAG: carbohydrate kinase family protein [Candidatus Hodarchaeales archaeon]
MKEILCFGDVIIDFISKDKGKDVASSTLFEKRPGGSIFNVSIGLARLGLPVNFLSKVGNDEFGHYILELLKKEKVNPRWLLQEKAMKTSLAFAAVDSEGKTSFVFYKDTQSFAEISQEDVADLNPDQFCLYHFGSTSLLEQETSDTMINVLYKMKENGVLTSFDPNVRPTLVKNKENYLSMIKRLSGVSDIVKLSDDDLNYLFSTKNPDKARIYLGIGENTLLVVTLGEKGAAAYYRGDKITVPGFNVNVAETTGCGDAFMASLIAGLLDKGYPNINEESLRNILLRANAAAAIVATRIGAANSMPIWKEINEFITNNNSSV